MTRDAWETSTARTIESARRHATLVDPFTTPTDPVDLETAYRVAARAAAMRRVETGARSVGRKIGFTNRTIWERYGVHHPIWGWMYDDTVAFAADGRAEVPLGDLVAPRVEPEIVVRLAQPVRRGASVGDIAAAIDWVAFGFEIVHCHYDGWRFAAADAVIDAGLHGFSRIGPPAQPWPSLVDDLARFELTLLRDGVPLGTGHGADVLDSPLNAILHLADLLPDGLEGGEILTTGTVTDAAPANEGERYSVEIVGLPLEPFVLTCV